MGFDEPAQPGVSKRQFLKVAGGSALAGGGLVSTATGQENQRPTVTVQSAGCNRLTVAYTSGQVPLQITLEGPTSQTFQLGPAMVVPRTVDSGEYTVQAQVARGEAQSGAAVKINGSPITVEGCNGVRARAFCAIWDQPPNEGEPVVTFEFTNTADETAEINSYDYSGETRIAGFYSPVPAGGTHRYSQYTYWFSQRNITHKAFSATGATSGETIPVEPTRIEFPGNLSCLDS